MTARIASLMFGVVLTACSGSSVPLTADFLEINLPRPGTPMGVAYLELANSTAETITITSVSSPQFEAVEMHETVITDGISRMRQLDAVAIPAHGTAVFERGGKHLMLLRPTAEMDSVLLTFHADAVPVLTVRVDDPE